MRIRSVLSACAVVLGLVTAATAAPAPQASANFKVSEPIKVPGLSLQPGDYSIRVVDHLSDRLIMRVDQQGGNIHSTFIGLTNPSLKKPGTNGVINWETGPDGVAAARGFSFPNGNVVEFVYPKAEAVSIAKLNSTRVPAIDPASEGRVADPNLSKDDMEVVTLWTLSSTSVGANGEAPAIKADRYQQVASATPRKPVIAKLPHTASYLPLFILLSTLALCGASMLRYVRRSRVSAKS